jgi:hypothetical protein
VAGWNDGAIVDVAAEPRFHREVTPIWLSTACTLLGSRAPSLTQPFRYADLGCGAGIDALTVAATCPRAEVWGFDFNPANIENARDLAARAGLINIRFEEVSFAAMAAAEGTWPRFDFMVAESVLSVISPANMAHVHGLIGRYLLPGGLAYLGYACDAGWTGFEPIQSLMRMLYEAGTDASDFAVSQIFPWLDRLRAGGALLFQRTPNLDARLNALRQRSGAALAHDFLNKEWRALMFADVADAMAEVKCDFLGRATLHENIVAASVSHAMAPLLEEAASIRIRETMQDVAAATDYRRDIYRRGMAFLPVAEHRERLSAITVASTGQAATDWLGREPADLAMYAPLRAALADGPLSVAATLASGEGSIEAAADAIAMLIASGQAHPVMPQAVAQEAVAPVGRLNDAIIDAIARGEDLPHLVSPVLGSAVATNPFEALTIGALRAGEKPENLAGLTETVRMAMRRGGRTVVRDGAPVADEAQATAILREAVTRIVEHRVPLFRALGILRE